MSVTYSVFLFVALEIQHAMRIRHIVIVASLVLQIFKHNLINGTIFEKQNCWTQNVFRISLQLCTEVVMLPP